MNVSLPLGLAGAAASSYGPDPSGLICGYVFGGREGGRPVDGAEAARWLAQHQTQLQQAQASVEEGDGGPEAIEAENSEFLWLHFSVSHTGALPWLQAHGQLSEEFLELLRTALPSTRVDRAEQALIAVVNDVHFDFSFEPSEISTLWINIERHLVITARQKPLRSIDRLRESVKRGLRLRSTVELLDHLLHAQADVLVDIVRSATERVDHIEDRLLSNRLDGKRARLGALRRLLVRLQRLLAPEPAALVRLLQHPPEWIAELDVQGLRQASEEFSVVLRDMSSLQERIKLLQEEIAAQSNEENNRSLFLLTIVTVLALPINLIAGLLGMNVGGVPLAQHPHGFWIVVAIVASFTGFAGWFAFRHWRRGGD